MTSPIAEPPSVPPPSGSKRGAGGLPLWPVAGVLLLLVTGTLAYLVTSHPQDGGAAGGGKITVRPSATLLTAVRDVARLETTEVQVEKVIDLTDTQSRFFGLIETSDAILLVAAGDATIGVDLSKLRDDDVDFDPKTRVATFRLPAPEVLPSRLDEQRTYVYTRSTSLLARRNEHLETRARQEAIAAIEKAARDDELTRRAKAQAERELRSLATALGAADVQIVWR